MITLATHDNSNSHHYHYICYCIKLLHAVHLMHHSKECILVHGHCTLDAHVCTWTFWNWSENVLEQAVTIEVRSENNLGTTQKQGSTVKEQCAQVGLQGTKYKRAGSVPPPLTALLQHYMHLHIIFVWETLHISSFSVHCMH